MEPGAEHKAPTQEDLDGGSVSDRVGLYLPQQTHSAKNWHGWTTIPPASRMDGEALPPICPAVRWRPISSVVSRCPALVDMALLPGIQRPNVQRVTNREKRGSSSPAQERARLV